jgi:hypothetical protein
MNANLMEIVKGISPQPDNGFSNAEYVIAGGNILKLWGDSNQYFYLYDLRQQQFIRKANTMNNLDRFQEITTYSDKSKSFVAKFLEKDYVLVVFEDGSNSSLFKYVGREFNGFRPVQLANDSWGFYNSYRNNVEWKEDNYKLQGKEQPYQRYNNFYFSVRDKASYRLGRYKITKYYNEQHILYYQYGEFESIIDEGKTLLCKYLKDNGYIRFNKNDNGNFTAVPEELSSSETPQQPTLSAPIEEKPNRLPNHIEVCTVVKSANISNNCLQNDRKYNAKSSNEHIAWYVIDTNSIVVTQWAHGAHQICYYRDLDKNEKLIMNTTVPFIETNLIVNEQNLMEGFKKEIEQYLPKKSTIQEEAKDSTDYVDEVKTDHASTPTYQKTDEVTGMDVQELISDIQNIKSVLEKQGFSQDKIDETLFNLYPDYKRRIDEIKSLLETQGFTLSKINEVLTILYPVYIPLIVEEQVLQCERYADFTFGNRSYHLGLNEIWNEDNPFYRKGHIRKDNNIFILINKEEDNFSLSQDTSYQYNLKGQGSDRRFNQDIENQINKAISNGTNLLLFEKDSDDHIIFFDKAVYVGHDTISEGDRTVIQFHLKSLLRNN